MLSDIIAVREQSEWVSSAGAKPGERRGKRHFRDCETACPSFAVHRQLGNDAMLRADCAVCELRRGPREEARVCMELSSIPDAAMDLKSMPAWLVRGIGAHRVMSRSGL